MGCPGQEGLTGCVDVALGTWGGGGAWQCPKYPAFDAAGCLFPASDPGIGFW